MNNRSTIIVLSFIALLCAQFNVWAMFGKGASNTGTPKFVPTVVKSDDVLPNIPKPLSLPPSNQPALASTRTQKTQSEKPNLQRNASIQNMYRQTDQSKKNDSFSASNSDDVKVQNSEPDMLKKIEDDINTPPAVPPLPRPFGAPIPKEDFDAIELKVKAMTPTEVNVREKEVGVELEKLTTSFRDPNFVGKRPSGLLEYERPALEADPDAKRRYNLLRFEKAALKDSGAEQQFLSHQKVSSVVASNSTQQTTISSSNEQPRQLPSSDGKQVNDGLALKQAYDDAEQDVEAKKNAMLQAIMAGKDSDQAIQDAGAAQEKFEMVKKQADAWIAQNGRPLPEPEKIPLKAVSLPADDSLTSKIWGTDSVLNKKLDEMQATVNATQSKIDVINIRLKEIDDSFKGPLDSEKRKLLKQEQEDLEAALPKENSNLRDQQTKLNANIKNYDEISLSNKGQENRAVKEKQLVGSLGRVGGATLLLPAPLAMLATYLAGGFDKKSSSDSSKLSDQDSVTGSLASSSAPLRKLGESAVSGDNAPSPYHPCALAISAQQLYGRTLSNDELSGLTDIFTPFFDVANKAVALQAAAQQENRDLGADEQKQFDDYQHQIGLFERALFMTELDIRYAIERQSPDDNPAQSLTSCLAALDNQASDLSLQLSSQAGKLSVAHKAMIVASIANIAVEKIYLAAQIAMEQEMQAIVATLNADSSKTDDDKTAALAAEYQQRRIAMRQTLIDNQKVTARQIDEPFEHSRNRRVLVLLGIEQPMPYEFAEPQTVSW